MSKLLGPVVTGSALFALTLAPEKYRSELLSVLRQYISEQNITRAITALKWLFALGLYNSSTNFLNELAQNEFRWKSEKKRYHWPSEIVVVTGGSGGFGSLISKGLAAKGAKIMVLDVVDGLPPHLKDNPRIHYFKCDITSRDAVNEVAEQIRHRFGNPSVLVNNAGVSMGGLPILSISEKQLQTLFNVNTTSHYNTVQAFLPHMIKAKKGHIVTIASMASFVSTPGLVPYSQSKAAALAFHEGLQQELRTFHEAPEIKLTVVHPTFADTAMAADFKDSLEKTHAKLIRPEDVADAVVKQVLSGRGKQIILNGNLPYAVTAIRSWPPWLSNIALMGSNKAMKEGALGELTSKKVAEQGTILPK